MYEFLGLQPKNHQQAMKIVTGRNKPNETPAMQMVIMSV